MNMSIFGLVCHGQVGDIGFWSFVMGLMETKSNNPLYKAETIGQLLRVQISKLGGD